MSRNADEFEDQLRELFRRYQQAQENLRKQRRRLTQDVRALPIGLIETVDSENLEAHTRTYLVDGILAALGWRMAIGPDPVGQLLIEQPIREWHESAVKFMDYLGVEGQTERALLIVEAKRPGAELPRLNGIPPMVETEGAYQQIVAKGLADPDVLNLDWPKGFARWGGMRGQSSPGAGIGHCA